MKTTIIKLYYSNNINTYAQLSTYQSTTIPAVKYSSKLKLLYPITLNTPCLMFLHLGTYLKIVEEI